MMEHGARGARFEGRSLFADRVDLDAALWKAMPDARVSMSFGRRPVFRMRLAKMAKALGRRGCDGGAGFIGEPLAT